MIGTFKVKSIALTTDYKTQDNIITLIADKSNTSVCRQIIDDTQEGQEYQIVVDKPKKKRTLDQNAYMWVLLQRLAEATQQPKENIYRQIVKRVGSYGLICVPNKALEKFLTIWESRGIGWICETDSSKIPECTNVFCYYGSSAYSTREMKRLLDEVISECNDLNISTWCGEYKE